MGGWHKVGKGGLKILSIRFRSVFRQVPPHIHPRMGPRSKKKKKGFRFGDNLIPFDEYTIGVVPVDRKKLRQLRI